MRNKARGMIEADVEDEVVNWVVSEGGRAPKLVIYNEQGFPDRTLLLPGGKIVFPELKRPKGGRRRSRQELWVKWLNELGFQADFCTSIERVKELARKAGYE